MSTGSSSSESESKQIAFLPPVLGKKQNEIAGAPQAVCPYHWDLSGPRLHAEARAMAVAPSPDQSFAGPLSEGLKILLPPISVAVSYYCQQEHEGTSNPSLPWRLLINALLY